MRYLVTLLLALPIDSAGAQAERFEGLGFALLHPDSIEVAENGDGRAYFVEARRVESAEDRATPLLRISRLPGGAISPQDLLDLLERGTAAALEAAELVSEPPIEARRRILGELRTGRRAIWSLRGAPARAVEHYAFALGGDTVGVSSWIDFADGVETLALVSEMLESLEARDFDPLARRVHAAGGVRLEVPALTSMLRVVQGGGEVLTFDLSGARVEVAVLELADAQAAAAALGESIAAQERLLSELVARAGGRVAARRDLLRWRRGEVLRGQRFTLELADRARQEVRCYYLTLGSSAVGVTVTLLPDARDSAMQAAGALLDSLRPASGEPAAPPEPARVRGLGFSLDVPAGLRVGLEQAEGVARILLARGEVPRAGEPRLWFALRGGGDDLERLVEEELDAVVASGLPAARLESSGPCAGRLLEADAHGSIRELRDGEGASWSAAALAVRLEGGRALVAGRLGDAADAVDDDFTLRRLLEAASRDARETALDAHCGVLLALDRARSLHISDRLGERARRRVIAPELSALVLEGVLPEGGDSAAMVADEAARLARDDAEQRTARGEELGALVASARRMDGATASCWRRESARGSSAPSSGAWVLAHAEGVVSIEARWSGAAGAAALEELLAGLRVVVPLPAYERRVPLGPVAASVPAGFEPAARALEGGVALEVAPRGSRDCALWIEVRAAAPEDAAHLLVRAADAWTGRFEGVAVEREPAVRAVAGRDVSGLRLSAAADPPQRAELFALDGPGGVWLVSLTGAEAALLDAAPALAACAAGLGAPDQRTHAPVDTARLGAPLGFENGLLAFEHAAATSVNANVPARPELIAEDGSADLAVELSSLPADPGAVAFGRMRHRVADLEAQGRVTERYLLRRSLFGEVVEGQVSVVEQAGERRELHVYAARAGARGVVVEGWIRAGPGDLGPAHLELLLASLRVAVE